MIFDYLPIKSENISLVEISAYIKFAFQSTCSTSLVVLILNFLAPSINNHLHLDCKE